MDLMDHEIRVLGCLLEKQVLTPDAYPLSLNALRTACNQTTNRDPVVDYDDATVRDALARLGHRRWTRLASGAGSRAPKYRHLLEEALPLGAAERSLLTVLMLRGAQTPGELKQRTERLHSFADLGGVHVALDTLIDRGLAERLPRRPGQKEERYRQLLGADADASPAPPPAPPEHAERAMTAPPPSSDGDDRVGRLEREVAELREEVARLREALASHLPQA